jgi:Zn-dependent protease with chaperone function
MRAGTRSELGWEYKSLRAARRADPTLRQASDGDYVNGTQAILRFTPAACVLTIYSSKAVEPLVAAAACRRLSRSLGCVDAAIVYYPSAGADGSSSADERIYAFGIDLSRHLAKTPGRAFLDVDTGGIASALRGWPRPVLFVVASLHGASSTLHAASRSRALPSIWGMWLPERGPAPHIELSAESTWRDHATAALAVVTALLLIALPWLMVVPRRNRPSRTPEEVQRIYDRRLPVLVVGPAYGLLFGLALVPLRHMLVGAHLDYVLQDIPISAEGAALALPGALALSIMATWIVKRRIGGSAAKQRPGAALGQVIGRRILAITAIGAEVLGFTVIGVRFYSQADQDLGTLAFLALISIALLLLAAILLLCRLGPRNKGGEGPVVDRLRELVAKTGIRPKRVRLVSSPVANAMALFGTVVVTDRLAAGLEPDELDAVLAHELCHVRQRASLWSLLLSVPLIAALVTAMGSCDWLLRALPGDVRLVLFNPFLLFMVVALAYISVLGIVRRRWEYAADRFASQTVSDRETFVRALTKLYALNSYPMALKRLDEIVSLHPSLEHRIRAIRADIPA